MRGSFLCVDAVGGDLHFSNTTEGEEKLYDVFGRFFRGLSHDVAYRIGDRGLEHYTPGLQTSQVHPHELAGLQHRSTTKIFSLRTVECKPSLITESAKPSL